jgi:hypothetical protein
MDAIQLMALNASLSSPPKLLPWLAAEACVEMPRADALWRAAQDLSCERHEPGSPAQMALAIVLLRQALEREARASVVLRHARAWRRLQRRLAHRLLEFITVVLRAGQRALPQHLV